MGADVKYIYLDYAATAPLCDEARFAIRPFFHESGSKSVSMRANAGTLYTPGRFAYSKLEEARAQIAGAMGAKRASEIVFTSGATESVYLALSGLFKANGCKKIVTSEIEHACVIESAISIAGKENVVLLKPNRFGFVDVEALKSALSSDDKTLVSIQMANSEIGSIQDIKRLAYLAKESGAIFHSDVTQAVGKISFDLEGLGVDAASFSSHKLGGPFGVGALYVKRCSKFKTPIKGGGQEEGRRGGTQNVAGAVGFAAAVRTSVANIEAETQRLRAFKKKIREEVPNIGGEKRGQTCKMTVDEERSCGNFLPNICHLTLPSVESEVAILKFDEQNICVSGGSACSASSSGPSKVLVSIGKPVDEAVCALRVSFGRYTTEEEIDKFLEILERVIS